MINLTVWAFSSGDDLYTITDSAFLNMWTILAESLSSPKIMLRDSPLIRRANYVFYGSLWLSMILEALLGNDWLISNYFSSICEWSILMLTEFYFENILF